MEIKEMKKIKIIDFCNENGIPLIQNSREYYRLEEHDSCVISDKKNLFKWNSKNEGGDILNFIQSYYDCSFKEAIKKLSDKDYDTTGTNRMYERKDFVYNNKEVEVIKGKDYLINKRRIDKYLVDNLIEKGLIRQNEHDNILFVWKEDNNIVGCNEQGTKTFFDSKSKKLKTFKKIQENSKENRGFNIKYGEPKKLYFFESEIDLLSYITKYPNKTNNAQFISMNGLKKNTVFSSIENHFKKYNELPEINICVDNDKGGNTFFDEEFKGNTIGNEETGYVGFNQKIPHVLEYDWNDMLVNQSQIIKNLNTDDLSRIIQKKDNNSNILKKKELELDYS